MDTETIDKCIETVTAERDRWTRIGGVGVVALERALMRLRALRETGSDVIDFEHAKTSKARKSL